jgi:hypothetical protein
MAGKLWWVASAVMVGALAAAPAAWAQSASTRDRDGDASAFAWYRAAPLRLSLEGGIAPEAGGFANCVSREDGAGNSVGGIPVQHFAAFQLTPRLVLSGFTQLGCPIDAGIGGVLTYTIPLADSLWLGAGAGVYGAPGQVPLFGGLGPSLAQAARGGASAIDMAARTDLIWKTKSGRPFTLGVSTQGRSTQAIHFGGGF